MARLVERDALAATYERRVKQVVRWRVIHGEGPRQIAKALRAEFIDSAHRRLGDGAKKGGRRVASRRERPRRAGEPLAVKLVHVIADILRQSAKKLRRRVAGGRVSPREVGHALRQERSESSRGRYWPSLAVTGRYWPLQAVTGRQWPLLAVTGRHWPLLAATGRYWPLLAATGRDRYLREERSESSSRGRRQRVEQRHGGV